MTRAEKEGRTLYEVSDDNGYSWKQVWLTPTELEGALNNFYKVRECKFGFHVIPDAFQN